MQLAPVLPGEHLSEPWAVDGDGLSVRVEANYVVNKDGDRDGMSEDFETGHGLDAGLAGDALANADEDGLNNFDESAFGLDPTSENSDLDGLHGGVDTDPLDRDSDDDGLAYRAEDEDGNGSIGDNGTDAQSPDSDGDGMGDGIELGVTEPLPDPDGDGRLSGDMKN